MDINFSELDNITRQNPYDKNNYSYEDLQPKSNSEKYWEPQKNQIQEKFKKKKVSFDDILSNMNIVVNETGVLQFMAPKRTEQSEYNPQQPQYNTQQPQYNTQQPKYNPQQSQYNTQQSQYNTQQPQYNTQQSQIKKIQPLDPSVKQSFIYNKYFKDYQDSVPQEPEVKIPKTKEEYYQMLVEEKRRRIEEKIKISQIKSKKLLFTSNVGNQNNIHVSKNSLRTMSFR